MYGSALIVLLAVSAPDRVVGVLLTEADDPESARAVLERVIVTLAQSGGSAVRSGGSCADAECEARARKALQADALLRVRVLRGLTLLQVTLELVGSVERTTLTLPADHERWDELLAEPLARIFPPRPLHLAQGPPVAAPAPPPVPTWAAVVALGGVAAMGAGAAFALEARSTRRALLQDAPDAARFAELQGRVGPQSTAAVALLSAGALLGCAAIAGALLE